MKSIKKIIHTNQLETITGLQNQLRTQTSATKNFGSSGDRTETECVNKIFLKFSIFYGHIWRSQFKNEYYSDFARQEWSQALKQFDKELIDQALDGCLKNREMPPALSQFVECCKRLTKEKQVLQKEIYKPGDPIVAHTHLQKIKAILNMK